MTDAGRAQVGLLDAGLPAPAVGVFTTRLAGTSSAPWRAANLGLHTGDDRDRVKANRDLLARQLGLSPGRLTFAAQVHGCAVRLVGPAGARSRDDDLREDLLEDLPEDLPETDGLVTTTPGLGLVMMGADCPSVLLADAEARVVGAAHVGRRGLAAGVLLEVLRVMVGQGASAGRITAVIGPGACGRCYEVPKEMADDVERSAPGSRATTRHGSPGIDLTAGATRQLLDAGVSAVRAVGGCTIEQPELLFSYRREGVTGRQGGVVLLR